MLKGVPPKIYKAVLILLNLIKKQGGQKSWNNLEFDNLGKQKNLEFFRKIMEKPGTFFNLNFLTTSI